MYTETDMIYDDPMILDPIDSGDPVPIPLEPVVPGLPPELPDDPVLPISDKGKKIIKDVIATYYKKNKAHGELSVLYDMPALSAMAQKVLAANDMDVDTQQLKTEIEGNILSGAYKLSTDNDIFVYLFIAGIAIAVYFYFKSKKK
jgi:hypothetical protein